MQPFEEIRLASTDKLALRAIEDRRIRVIEMIAFVLFAAKFIFPFSYNLWNKISKIHAVFRSLHNK